MENGRLMTVGCIAECSPWSILQYFWPALSDNWYCKPILDVLFEWPLYCTGKFGRKQSHQYIVHSWHCTFNQYWQKVSLKVATTTATNDQICGIALGVGNNPAGICTESTSLFFKRFCVCLELRPDASHNRPLHRTVHMKLKVKKRAKIRNIYNQAPHLTQDTNGKVTIHN